MIMAKKIVVLAAGGTGGHIFPAESLAEELIKGGFIPVLMTDDRFENYPGKFKENEYYIICSASLQGGLLKKLRAVLCMARGFYQAKKILKKLSPVVVIGFGGYPSLPTMFAAANLGHRTIIHEQNAYLGRVNSLLANMVNVIAVSFQQVHGVKEKDYKKAYFTGNPVRSSILALHDVPYPKLGSKENIHILVTGGSQGATIFAKIVPAAIKLLSDDVKKRIRIDQQCRKENLEQVREMYKEMGVNADLNSFFEDIPARLASSHIVIARAGASTISELTVAGRPAILIPYMHAKDDHQSFNAKVIESEGAAIVISEKEITPEILAAKLQEMIKSKNMLSDMAKKSLSLGELKASKNLASLV